MKNAGQKRNKMKKGLTIFFIVLTGFTFGQSKKMMEAMSNARLLEMAVFDTKDNTSLQSLFAKTVSYTDQDGNILSREEAIKTIVNNKSVYSQENSPSAYGPREVNDSMIVKHIYSATEKRADGTESAIKFSIESVWAKESGKLKLFRCLIAKL